MRQILNIPPNTHNYLIPLLLNSALPFLDDVCKRSARFVFSCIQSDSSLVRSIAKHAYLKAAVILLLGKMRRFYADILVGNWLILYIAKLILVTSAFCLTFITRLVTLNGVRLSCLKMFFLLVMMNLR